MKMPPPEMLVAPLEKGNATALLRTAIGSHCLAALPAKMSAFNNNMWKNANILT